MCSDLEKEFPNLCNEGYCITSERTPRYNCIAWAANDNTRWWWPDQLYQYYWPIRTRNLRLETFKEAFATLKYVSCGKDASLEHEIEKIAFYTRGFFVEHMARQLPSGEWTSKCGRLEDITHHTLTGFEPEYGHVAEIMKRPRMQG